jgi:FkbM family methyltransferase
MKLRTQGPLWRRVVRLVGRQLFRLAENNDDPRSGRNGERWLLNRLLATHARAEAGRAFVVFDGGANVGDYTGEVLAAGARAGVRVEVHAFEPSPFCVAQLQQRFSAEPAVRLVGAALADRTGEAPLHEGRGGSSQASLLARPGRPATSGADVTVPLVRLGDYLETRAISRVDLLKLDVEGSELAVLRGLGSWLRPEVIDVIQFEYGGTALDAGITLRDQFRLLAAQGYLLAKVFPRALEVRTYRPWMEHYAYANYAAVAPRWLASRHDSP